MWTWRHLTNTYSVGDYEETLTIKYTDIVKMSLSFIGLPRAEITASDINIGYL